MDSRQRNWEKSGLFLNIEKSFLFQQEKMEHGQIKHNREIRDLYEAPEVMADDWDGLDM